MKHLKALSGIILIISLVACQKDIPEPENKIKIIPMSYVNTENDVPVSSIQNERKQERLSVHHHVKGTNLFVECMVKDISFRENSEKSKGKILLYVDGKKKDEIHTAAFIVKGLTPGTHKIKLEIVKPNNKTLGLKKEFTVIVP
ncbi:hypothetical protein LS684_07575 [Cytobacillus spongiae]|jgi:hypothetical protein|uniref:DUF6130 family protein n=1 Tax=Cytobacillus spongiae TaxID=2901381 RepID=UPI001F42D657|nr:DUF6130 family protein [Cytobacillus spongiae]UII57290.1 hypothetical protein LS684_07575 [Cytobacillus spongiae]